MSFRHATISSTGCESSTALLAAERAKLLLGCYRRNDATDPETYVLAMTAVLAMYEPAVVREVTDPRTGIQTTGKFTAFPPNAGELKSYCEAHAAHRARLRAYAEMPKPDLTRRALPAPVHAPVPGRRANLLAPADSPRYGEMVERARSPGADPAEFEFTARGIRVALSWWRR